jgi:hypothetical protein
MYNHYDNSKSFSICIPKLLMVKEVATSMEAYRIVDHYNQLGYKCKVINYV